MSNTITLIIDGVEIKTAKGKRILEAALDNGIYIPNLCSLRDIKLPFGACRLCQVQIEGKRGTITSCSEPAANGMVIHSNTPEVNSVRRQILQIMLARHPHDCLTCWRKERCKPFDICLRNVDVTERCVTCPKNNRCDLQRAVDFIGLDNMVYPYKSKGLPLETDNPFIARNNNLCILCGRCIRVCQEILGIEAIAFNLRGSRTFIGGAFGRSLIESGCTFCGSCVEVCPVGALMDKEDQWHLWTDRESASIRCKYACPANVDIPRFIRFIREDKFNEAAAVIREKVPFISICSLACEHPCEISCRRNDLDQSVAIRALERFAVERAKDLATGEINKMPSSGKKVAIIGSGPAGLSAAYYLAKKGGHAVTVFEALNKTGGSMRSLIPEYVLPRKIIETELEILNKYGVEIKTQQKIESLNELINKGYDAIFVAIGAQKGTKMGIEVEDKTSIIDGFALLQQTSSGQKPTVGNKIAVIGNKNITLYVARTTLRLGAKTVVIISNKSDEELEIPANELALAQTEGIEIKTGLTPMSIAKRAGKTLLVCSDNSKSRTNGSSCAIEFDTIVLANSAVPDVPSQFGLSNNDEGTITVDPKNLMTSKKGIFAGGDAVTGKLSFIEAIASGRKAAISIDQYLMGDGNINEILAPVPEGIPRIGKIDKFAQRKRNEIPCLASEKLINNFSLVELGFDENSGKDESLRCMSCDVRFKLDPMVANPEREKSTANIISNPSHQTFAASV